jgi:hypothetical protein
MGIATDSTKCRILLAVRNELTLLIGHAAFTDARTEVALLCHDAVPVVHIRRGCWTEQRVAATQYKSAEHDEILLSHLNNLSTIYLLEGGRRSAGSLERGDFETRVESWSE